MYVCMCVRVCVRVWVWVCGSVCIPICVGGLLVSVGNGVCLCVRILNIKIANDIRLHRINPQ